MKNNFKKIVITGIIIPIVGGLMSGIWLLTSNGIQAKAEAVVSKSITVLKKENNKKFDRLEKKIDTLIFHLIPRNGSSK